MNGTIESFFYVGDERHAVIECEIDGNKKNYNIVVENEKSRGWHLFLCL